MKRAAVLAKVGRAAGALFIFAVEQMVASASLKN